MVIPIGCWSILEGAISCYPHRLESRTRKCTSFHSATSVARVEPPPLWGGHFLVTARGT